MKSCTKILIGFRLVRSVGIMLTEEITNEDYRLEDYPLLTPDQLRTTIEVSLRLRDEHLTIRPLYMFEGGGKGGTYRTISTL